MLVAVPTFHGRVSPTFDFCHRVTFWQVQGSGFRKLAERTCRLVEPSEKADKLRAMGTELLLCGAISAPLALCVTSRGIRILSGIAGNVAEVLTAFTQGGLDEPRFQIPGALPGPSHPGGAR